MLGSCAAPSCPVRESTAATLTHGCALRYGCLRIRAHCSPRRAINECDAFARSAFAACSASLRSRAQPDRSFASRAFAHGSCRTFIGASHAWQLAWLRFRGCATHVRMSAVGSRAARLACARSRLACIDLPTRLRAILLGCPALHAIWRLRRSAWRARLTTHGLCADAVAQLSKRTRDPHALPRQQLWLVQPGNAPSAGFGGAFRPVPPSKARLCSRGALPSPASASARLIARLALICSWRGSEQPHASLRPRPSPRHLFLAVASSSPYHLARYSHGCMVTPISAMSCAFSAAVSVMMLSSNVT